MKLVSLNIWGGIAFDALMEFIEEMQPSTEIFCFQEVYDSPHTIVSNNTRLNILRTLTTTLPEFQPFFEPTQDRIDEEGAIDIEASMGQAVFIRKEFPIDGRGFIFTYRDRNAMQESDWFTLPAGFQYLHLRTRKDGKSFTIINIHGISQPGDKLDTPARIAQSKKIQEFLAHTQGAKILCGDFNLERETKSVKMLEANTKNLITEYNIATTRSILNRSKFPPDQIQNFADYIFISPEVEVCSFEVPDIPVSDHLPMILEFSLT